MYRQQDAMAGANSAVLLAQLESHRSTSVQQSVQTQENELPQMPVKTLSGYELIGRIQVESLGVDLPVLSGWSMEMLNIAPCRYSGSLQTSDMILMGHNYESHFLPLLEISEGAKVAFEDAGGVWHEYRVALVETLKAYEGEKLPSEYPLTIFTCTRGGQNRFVIRCEKQDES